MIESSQSGEICIADLIPTMGSEKAHRFMGYVADQVTLAISRPESRAIVRWRHEPNKSIGRFEIIKGSGPQLPCRSYEYSRDEMECLSECWKANKQVTPTLIAFLSHYPSDLDRVLDLILPHLQGIMDGKPFWPEKE